MPVVKVYDNPQNVSNKEFLQAIFGDEWGKAHVTSFPDDPSDIHNDRRGICWGGGSASDRLERFKPDENQYFTISLFQPDPESGRSVRRKALFDATFVIVADDVMEKIPQEQAEKLPQPSYKLYTSTGSQQWGWILDEAESDAARVNALLDGLVHQGLAPDGKDPGMRGLTRYVRLPGGSNTKKKRLIDGKPYQCILYDWHPELMYSLEELAEAFDIDLNVKAEQQADVDAFSESDLQSLGHPLPDLLVSTGYGSDGWIRINCVNARAHTDADASGAAYRVLKDGTVQYACHHGHCESITGRVMVAMLDDQLEQGGMLSGAVNKLAAEIKTLGRQELAEAVGGKPEKENELSQAHSGSVFDRYVFLPPSNKFYDTVSRSQIPTTAINLLYKGIFTGQRNDPVFTSRFAEYMAGDPSFYTADAIGWMPTGMHAPDRAHLIYQQNGKRVINMWRGLALTPVPGDVTPWLEHVHYLMPDPREAEVFINFCAALFQRIDVKPAFSVLIRGKHRNGKDLVLRPLHQILGSAARAVSIDNVVGGTNWGDYLSGLKLLIMEEVDKAQNKRVANALKTIIAPTAGGVRTNNMKGGSVTEEADLFGVIMMSNHKHPIAIERGDERYFVCDAWVDPKDAGYYDALMDWYRNDDGAAKLLNYFLSLDISGFSSSRLPYRTKGFDEMVEGGRYDYEVDLVEALTCRDSFPFNGAFVTSQQLSAWKKENQVKGHISLLLPVLFEHGYGQAMRGEKRVDGKLNKTPTFYVHLDSVPEDADLSTPLGQFEFFYSLKYNID